MKHHLNVCSLSFIVCGSSFVVYRLWFVVCRVSFVVCGLNLFSTSNDKQQTTNLSYSFAIGLPFSALSNSTFKLLIMNSCLSGVFLPIKYSRICCTWVSGITITG